jgi:hypothetical protein
LESEFGVGLEKREPRWDLIYSWLMRLKKPPIEIEATNREPRFGFS